MVLKLYGDLRSPCVRAVVFTAKILNIDIEYITIDLFKKEHHSSEFVEKNPTRTVPTLDDNGTIIWDSHAIMIYLAEKYGNNNPIYPSDIEKRAKINQMLHFEGGYFALHKFIALSIIQQGLKQIPEYPVEQLKILHEFLNTILKDSKYLTGDELTLADLSVWTTLTNSQIYLTVDATQNPKLVEYLKVMDSLPYADINQKGKNDIAAIFNALLKK